MLTAAVFLLAASSVFAQATSQITGRVVDQDGAVLPGVNVTVTNMGTGVARDTVTNNEGLYSVPALNPGNYSVRAELAGLRAAGARQDRSCSPARTWRSR